MEVSLNANMYDNQTYKFSPILHDPLKAISRRLSGDYGGIMDHLWIDFELIQSHVEHRGPRTFRFQKRVSGRGNLTGIDFPDRHNVGHYSVCPDFSIMMALPLVGIPSYVLETIYASTTVLHEKSKRLGGFNAEMFRDRFLVACSDEGFPLNESGNAT